MAPLPLPVPMPPPPPPPLSHRLVGVNGEEGGGEWEEGSVGVAAPRLFPSIVGTVGDEDMCVGGGEGGGEAPPPENHIRVHAS